MANTYKLISSNILSSTTGSITFLSIPNTYTDLIIKLSTRLNGTGAGTANIISFNGSSASFSGRILFGDATSARSVASTVGGIGATDGTTESANTFNICEVYIPNYTLSANKTFGSNWASENNTTNTGAYVGITAALWSNTAAITSITITPEAGSFVSGSSFYLYGIKSS